MKRIAILGSTGSVGRQTLEVALSWRDRVQVVALAGGRNTKLLARQVLDFKPALVYSLEPLDEDLLFNVGARHPEVDLVVVATGGAAGLTPTLAALEAGKTVALANKEALVMAGALVIETARKSGATILPVDSEHSGLWQCLAETRDSDVESLVITASGGAFRDYPLERLATVTPEEALRHPTWSMGPKITIDSATLMNKGLEVIEARWLFGVTLERIEVVLHRESIVHALAKLVDGTVRMQLSQPDMRIPIQYALSYPERWDVLNLPKLDFSTITPLTFTDIEPGRYPCFELALEAGRAGGTYPAALVGADEGVVELFLKGCIPFSDISKLVSKALDHHKPVYQPSLEEVLEAESWGRIFIGEM
ncbi:MAG: dxr [Dehalococcoidia bacterium]|nr:dxr [Dehalococcoidia bacterium]